MSGERNAWSCLSSQISVGERYFGRDATVKNVCKQTFRPRIFLWLNLDFVFCLSPFHQNRMQKSSKNCEILSRGQKTNRKSFNKLPNCHSRCTASLGFVVILSQLEFVDEDDFA